METAAEWFECDDELPNELADFLQAARVEAEHWNDANSAHSQVYIWDDRIVLGMDVCDLERSSVLRALRADYGASGLVYGDDETHQFTTDLIFKQPEYRHIEHNTQSAANHGRTAVTWFRSQMERPIELLEWKRFGFWGYWRRQYRLADTGRLLSWSAKGNNRRTGLGNPNRVIPVVTLNKNAGAA
ncbi:MAG: hypothetical protein GKS00_09075 [Alphaproteobacteria bacterium]|nr:hypothetical protein [Alphaproteobacteria bacterium]